MMVVGDTLLGSGTGTLVLWAAVDQALVGSTPARGKWHYLMKLLLTLLLTGSPSALYECVFNLQIFRQTLRVGSSVNKVKRTRLKTRE